MIQLRLTETDSITKAEARLLLWRNEPFFYLIVTVPDELSNHIDKFITKKVEKAIQGNKTAVSKEFFSQLVP